MLIGFNLLLWTTHVTEEHFPLFGGRSSAPAMTASSCRSSRATPRTSRASAAVLARRGPALHRRHRAARRGAPAPSARTRPRAQGAVDRLRWAVDCLHAAGGEVLAGPFHQPLGVFTGDPPTAAERDRLVEVHMPGGRLRARRPGSRSSIEPLNRFECYVLNTVADAAAIVRAGRPAELRPALRHVPRQHRGEGPDRRDPRRTSRRSTTSTSPRTTAARPARATCRSATTFAALKDGGYDGWYVIEAFGRALPALAAATRVWRDFFPDREEVYRHGFQVIQDGWAAA